MREGTLPMKTINIKLSLPHVQEMDDRGQLNPYYITDFINKHIGNEIEDHPVGRLGYYYALKVDEKLHNTVATRAKKEGLAMGELLGRLFLSYYDGMKANG